MYSECISMSKHITISNRAEEKLPNKETSELHFPAEQLNTFDPLLQVPHTLLNVQVKSTGFIVFIEQRYHNWSGMLNTVNISRGQKLIASTAACSKSTLFRTFKGKVYFNHFYLS